MSMLLHSFILFLSFIRLGSTFKWEVDEQLTVDNFFTFSERYMFGEGDGPPMLEQGKAYIDIDMIVTT
jgi:hypothetical protein